jgi:hypothetical protein
MATLDEVVDLMLEKLQSSGLDPSVDRSASITIDFVDLCRAIDSALALPPSPGSGTASLAAMDVEMEFGIKIALAADAIWAGLPHR